MHKLKLVSVLLLLLLLSGCGLFGGGAVNLTGNWGGTLSVSGQSAPITMALTQSDTAITGTLTSPNGSGSLTVGGTLTGTSLAITLNGLPLTGTASATTINATFSGPDETGNVVTVTLAATKQ